MTSWTPKPSVNVKWVEKWKRDDVEKWVKCLQDMQLIEGKGTQQANIIYQIIKQRNITGRELAKCATFQNIMQLFLSKINQKTGRLLFDCLNMERAMFQKKELSKMAIKKGKWIPRLGEKIRVVDTKFKPLRSYESEIVEVGSGYIIVLYGGYKTTNRVNRNEWDGRITILEDKPQSNTAPPNRRLPQSAKSSKNVLPQPNSAPGLPKRRSVPPTNVPYIPPFRSKKVSQWNPDDVSDWIQSVEIDAPKKYQESIQKRKISFAQACAVNKVSGKMLKKFNSGQRIFNEFQQYGVTDKFCNAIYNELKNVLNTEHAFADHPKLSPDVDQWTTQDLQAWVNSLNLEQKKAHKAISVIKQDNLTGADFVDVKHAHEIVDSLHIDPVTAAKLFHELKKKISASPQKKRSSPQPPAYSNMGKSVNVGDVRGMLNEPTKELFYEGQNFEAWDGKGWFPAVVKVVKPYGVKIGWKMQKYSHEKWDKWINEGDWKTHIRDPQTGQPFGASVDASAGFKDAGGYVKHGNHNQGQGAKSYKYKHIDEWTCNELQQWVKTVGLNKKNQKAVAATIAEQEITGHDFNSMTEVDEIMDSFEISKTAANKIFQALSSVSTNTSDNNVVVSKRSSGSIKSGRGIIGLDNLGNTCFINSVIQALLQTPGLIEYLRKYAAASIKEKSGGSMFSGWFGGGNKLAVNMLEAFIEVAAAAMQSSNSYDSIPPKAIVQHLRNSDVKFGRGEQGDALSAVSKMTELMDKHIIIKQKKTGKGKGAKRHPGEWHLELKNDDPEFDDDEVTEHNLMQYNPYESPIRDHIHFVERNIFTCLKCGWQEARYDIKEKVLLPLKDHSTDISVDVYIPSINRNGPELSKLKCVILDYCPIQTLRYQIFDEIRTNDDVTFDMKNVDQISIKTMKADRNKLLSGWIQEYDAKEDCSKLTKTHRSIFAVVDLPKKYKNKSLITVTTLHVCVDKHGKVDQNSSHLEFDEMKTTQKKSFEEKDAQSYPKKYMHIFFGERIFNSNYECRVSHRNAVIVVIWTHAKATKRYKWVQPDIKSIAPIWQCEIWNHTTGNMSKYSDIEGFLQGKLDQYNEYAKTLNNSAKKAFTAEWIDNSLEKALITYKTLASDQKKAIELVYEAFAKTKSSFTKKNQIVDDIKEGFKTYCSTKVLDRGAVLKCGGCRKKCDVFKQETKIVRFSDVLVFAIDRYISGDKFEDVVGYGEFQTFDGKNYELYAVCNHEGTNNYGHYWAYVKGYNDNEWYEANDNRIIPMDVRQVVEKETAIVLFYKKKNK